MHAATAGPWPYEAASFQSLCKQTQPIPVPPQQLHAITAATTKHEQRTREWILRQLQLYQCCQAIEPLAHVCHAAAQPDPSSERQADHRTAASTSRNIASSIRPRTRMQPLSTSISITASGG